jgi:ribose 5-phosphate isomerase B
MRIALGTDHAGFVAKEAVKAKLLALKHEVHDFGCSSEASCDYPDFVAPAARAVARGACDRGFVFGGSGNGEAMVANKVKGVRCAVVHDSFTAEMARRHNDAQLASFGTRVTPTERILALVEVFLATPYDGGRHAPRVAKLMALEE